MQMYCKSKLVVHQTKEKWVSIYDTKNDAVIYEEWHMKFQSKKDQI